MKMRRQLIGLWPLIFAVLTAGGAASAKEATSICQSPKGSFSTVCPLGWNSLDALDDSINIISFPPSQREEGVVIKDGGAQIIVSRHKLDGALLAQWIKKDNIGTRALSRKLRGESIRNTVCQNTSYLEVELNQGSPPSEIDSQIYCSSGEDVFKFRLRFWSDDPKAANYRFVLKNMFINLRRH